jgi:hypothetical protein
MPIRVEFVVTLDCYSKISLATKEKRREDELRKRKLIRRCGLDDKPWTENLTVKYQLYLEAGRSMTLK